jgi:hypothetical protein
MKCAGVPSRSRARGLLFWTYSFSRTNKLTKIES